MQKNKIIQFLKPNAIKVIITIAIILIGLLFHSVTRTCFLRPQTEAHNPKIEIPIYCYFSFPLLQQFGIPEGRGLLESDYAFAPFIIFTILLFPPYLNLIYLILFLNVLSIYLISCAIFSLMKKK